MTNVMLNTSKEGTPEGMIRDLLAWRRIRKPSSFRTIVVPSPPMLAIAIHYHRRRNGS